jgi:hypothetical protein
MTAIQASSAGIRDMADGSLRITFEFDPRYAKDAYAMFGARGTSCAIAALTLAASVQAAQQETVASAPAVKPGPLCIMACTFCADPMFQKWWGLKSEAEAKALILDVCAIESRKDLDLLPYAAEHFHNDIRKPFLAWKAMQ